MCEADVGNLRLEIAYRFPPAVCISDKRVVLPCSWIDQPQVASVSPRISGLTIEATFPCRLILIRKIRAIRMPLAWMCYPMLNRLAVVPFDPHGGDVHSNEYAVVWQNFGLIGLVFAVNG